MVYTVLLQMLVFLNLAKFLLCMWERDREVDSYSLEGATTNVWKAFVTVSVLHRNILVLFC